MVNKEQKVLKILQEAELIEILIGKISEAYIRQLKDTDLDLLYDSVIRLSTRSTGE